MQLLNRSLCSALRVVNASFYIVVRIPRNDIFSGARPGDLYTASRADRVEALRCHFSLPKLRYFSCTYLEVQVVSSAGQRSTRMSSSGSIATLFAPTQRLMSVVSHLNSRRFKVVVCRNIGPDAMALLEARAELDVSWHPLISKGETD
jgi:hypothetical protein